MEAKGSKRVAIAGIDDKRQITAVLSVIMSGHFLPPRIIYKEDRYPLCHFLQGGM